MKEEYFHKKVEVQKKEKKYARVVETVSNILNLPKTKKNDLFTI